MYTHVNIYAYIYTIYTDTLTYINKAIYAYDFI